MFPNCFSIHQLLIQVFLMKLLLTACTDLTLIEFPDLLHHYSSRYKEKSQFKSSQFFCCHNKLGKLRKHVLKQTKYLSKQFYAMSWKSLLFLICQYYPLYFDFYSMRRVFNLKVFTYFSLCIFLIIYWDNIILII